MWINSEGLFTSHSGKSIYVGVRNLERSSDSFVFNCRTLGKLLNFFESQIVLLEIMTGIIKSALPKPQGYCGLKWEKVLGKPLMKRFLLLSRVFSFIGNINASTLLLVYAT